MKFQRGSKNLDYAMPHLDISDNVSDALQLIAADAQTSGGLLLSVPSDNLNAVMDTLEESGAPCAVVIGKTIPRQDKAIRLSAS